MNNPFAKTPPPPPPPRRQRARGATQAPPSHTPQIPKVTDAHQVLAATEHEMNPFEEDPFWDGADDVSVNPSRNVTEKKTLSPMTPWYPIAETMLQNRILMRGATVLFWSQMEVTSSQGMSSRHPTLRRFSVPSKVSHGQL
jgi:hypothetical protein